MDPGGPETCQGSLPMQAPAAECLEVVRVDAAGEEGGGKPLQEPSAPLEVGPPVFPFPCLAEKENDRIYHTGILNTESTGAWHMPVERTEEPGLAAAHSSHHQAHPQLHPEATSLQRAAVQGPQAAPTCESKILNDPYLV